MNRDWAFHRLDPHTLREVFVFLAKQAEPLGIHPGNRDSLSTWVVKDAVDAFADIDREPGVRAFDEVVAIVDLIRDACEADEKNALETELYDALLVLVPGPISRPSLGLAS